MHESIYGAAREVALSPVFERKILTSPNGGRQLHIVLAQRADERCRNAQRDVDRSIG